MLFLSIFFKVWKNETPHNLGWECSFANTCSSFAYLTKTVHINLECDSVQLFFGSVKFLQVEKKVQEQMWAKAEKQEKKILGFQLFGSCPVFKMFCAQATKKFLECATFFSKKSLSQKNWKPKLFFFQTNSFHGICFFKF